MRELKVLAALILFVSLYKENTSTRHAFALRSRMQPDLI
jgi:hypothetical protein